MDAFQNLQAHLQPALENLASNINITSTPPLSNLVLPTMSSLMTFLLQSSVGARALAIYDSICTSYLDPYFLAPIASIVDSPPSLSTILMMLTILYLSLRILDYTRRIILFWAKLVLRVVFWAALIGAAGYIYHFGFEDSIRVVNESVAYVQQSVEAMGREPHVTSRAGWW